MSGEDRAIDPPAVLDDVSFVVEDGMFERGSWVYAWLDDGDPPGVVYVGATWLPPAARGLLHLRDPDPAVGRIRSEHASLLSGRATLRAFRLDPALDRLLVKSLVIRSLAGEALAATATVEAAAALEIADRLAVSR